LHSGLATECIDKLRLFENALGLNVIHEPKCGFPKTRYMPIKQGV